LPTGSSVQGQSYVAVWNAQLKLWGFLGANDTTTDDGSATFATDINPNLLVGVALHELTHAMGRVPYGPQPDVFDLFRFTSVGTRLFAGGNTAPAAYFSTDGGHTKIADFGQTSDPSDFLNSGVQGPNDPFNEFYDGSTIQGLTAADKQILDALGFHTLTPIRTVIEAFGSTSLVEVGTNYFLNPVSGGNGPQLEYQGAPVVAGQFGSWTPVGAEQTSGGGYEVAWQVLGTDEFTLWTIDSNGNYVSSSSAIGGTSSALETAETVLHQDLNGDGVIGVAAANVIEAAGSTRLVELGSNFYLESAAGYGPELQYGSSPVASGQFASWTALGAEQTTTGYEVVWKNAGTDQFVIWGTDSGGHQTSSTAAYDATSSTLEQAELSFHQDLNGDGTIGPPAQPSTVIEAFGSTSLVESGSDYYLDPVSGGTTGPSLKYSGSPVISGQFGSWTPIGAEPTTIGYEVAWKNTATDQFLFWNTDSDGNQISSAGTYDATNATLEQTELGFHQDLNGDGTIGPVFQTGTVIEAFGATSLVQSGDNYFLDSVSGGTTGPTLKYSGAPVVSGQFGSWTPVGAEQTTTGYEVAWKNTATDQFLFWNTDSDGNQTSSAGAYDATNATLEQAELSFHQDLNGDGTIGPLSQSSTVIEAFGSTSLLQSGSNYYLNLVSGGTTGPSLKYSGSPVVSGQFGSWTPIGAEQTTTGYEVAWKNTATGQFTIWNTDGNGNQTTSAGPYDATNVTLEQAEFSFHQDLNGDGVIGVPAHVTTGSHDSLVDQGLTNGSPLEIALAEIFHGFIIR
jgi:hypothetical protein